MKKYIYSLLFCFTVGICSAQLTSVIQAEYFWDTDPGEGNGIAISAVDGNFNNSFERIAVSGLGAPSVGLHKFSIRIKDNTGIWSPVFSNVIKVETTTSPATINLVQAEYFWDADPGEGNGIALSTVDGDFNTSFEKIAVSGLNAPSVGLHKFSVRIKDDLGIWSPVFTNVINVDTTTTPSIVSLSEAEYFWDTDPGEGNGIAFLATDGNFNTAFEKLEKIAIPIVNPVGFHTFNSRIKDSNGNWSPIFKNVIYIETVLGSDEFSFSKIVIYPNPVKDILNFSFDKEITAVSIINLLGQEVLSKSLINGETSIDVASLSAGTYLVKVTSANEVKTVKVIKK